MKRFNLNAVLLMLIVLAIVMPSLVASDHGDTPLLKEMGRHDARLTDLYTFLRGDRIVFVVCLDPTIPPAATEYKFAPDLSVRIFVDQDSEVLFDDPADLATFGGSIIEPRRVAEDLSFRIRFDEDGNPKLRATGLGSITNLDIRLFAGLRDDPFIRAPREGRNIAALVLDLPLYEVLGDQSTLLVWASSKIEGVAGSSQDLVGRALRSQFPENDSMNVMRPRDHFTRLGLVPDVLILDTSRQVSFPNGRELNDDVVDLVGDIRVLGNDAPFPSMNDLPFLNGFPYLSPPHPAP